VSSPAGGVAQKSVDDIKCMMDDLELEIDSPVWHSDIETHWYSAVILS